MHPGSLAGATNRARVQQRRFIWRAWSGPMRGVRCQPISDFENPSQTTTALQPRFAVNEMLQCIRAVSPEPLILPVSSVGAFLREVGHELTTDSRGRTAWCSPTALSDSNRPVRQNRRCSQAVPPKHAGCDSAPQELPSRTRFTRDCRDRNFGPKMSQNAMYRPYIAMIASPAISWRPRPILARPMMVPDTPRCALHAGGVSLTRLGRPEKSTFWWPRRVVRAAPRLVPQASF
eukprot:6207650-Prymnesium_polylepis.1